MAIHDPIIDVPKNKLLLEELIAHIFNSDKIEYMTGKSNIKKDMIIHNAFKSGESYPTELKARGLGTDRYYNDIAVEISQYQAVSDGYKQRLMDGFKKEEIIKYLEGQNGAGWLFHTKAKVILIIARHHVDVINFKAMKRWMYKNFNSLEDKYCGVTTGAYNKIFNLDKETKEFTMRFTDEQTKFILKELYV